MSWKRDTKIKFFSTADAPTGSSTDFIPYDEYNTRLTQYKADLLAVQQEGFTSIGEAVDWAVQNFETERSRKEEGNNFIFLGKKNYKILNKLIFFI